MSVPAYTNTELVLRIRRAAQLAATNEKLSDAEVLQIADECIQVNLWPRVRAVIEGYAQTVGYLHLTPPTDISPQSDANSVRLPSRASASTITAVYDSSTAGTRELKRIDVTEAMKFGEPVWNTMPTAAHPEAYCIVGDYLAIVPAASEPVHLKLLYERRPSRLVPVAECVSLAGAAIENDGYLHLTATASIPAGVTVSGYVDIIPASPQMTDPWADDAQILTTVSATEIAVGVFNGPMIAQGLQAGDFIAAPNTTPVFPLPDVLWPVAIAQSAADCLAQCGYMAESGAMQPEIDRRLAVAIAHLTVRVRNQPLPVFDRDSPLRSNRLNPWGMRW